MNPNEMTSKQLSEQTASPGSAPSSQEPSPVQLSLGVSLSDDATFDNFFACGDNVQVLAALRALACGTENHNHLVWGSVSSGLTHLMQAVCHHGAQNNRYVQYLPMANLIASGASAVCDGLESSALICIDDIEYVCGNAPWEHALFHLFNRVRDCGHTLVFASHKSPATLPFELADLKSRVLGSLVYRVENLSDDEKQEAIMMRAEARGLHMSADIAKYILSRASRDMNELFCLLNRLDDESLQQQRKLTIPFVKEALGF